MATGYTVSGRGDLDVLFKARTSAAGANTNFKSNGGVDLAQRFEPRGVTTAIANTGYKVGANDLASIFMDIAASTFTPVTNTYNSGTGATETVPAGATSCVISLWGPGGGGSRQTAGTGDSQGGDSGAYCTRTVAVTGGQTFTYTVGLGGAGRTGSVGSGNPGSVATTVSSASPSVSMSAGRGLGGANGGPGAAAAASGGTTNTSGNPGLNPSGGSAPNGGAGGATFGNAGTAPGGGGAGGNLSNGNGGTGAAGRVSFAYT